MKEDGVKWIAGTLMVATALIADVSVQDKQPSAADVLAELKARSDAHAAQHCQHPHQTAARQRELTTTQHPHATILSCADSRVAPEIVFDQGLGDLFDVRVAGNIAGDAEIASIEYAADHLGVPVLVVLGHQRCGAVTAAAEPGEAAGHLPVLIAAIRPAIEQARGMPGEGIDNAVRVNVENVVRQLTGSQPVLAGLTAAGRLQVVGAVYSLDTGKIEWLPKDRRSR